MTISQVKENLIGMSHNATLNKVRNPEALFERAANNLISRIDPLDTIRTAPLSTTIHSDVYNYALPSDFKKPIDLRPQVSRTKADVGLRQFSQEFDLSKDFENKGILITSNNGTKFMRVSWPVNNPKTLHSMDSVTANGTWSAVGTATGIQAQDLYYISGNASIEFDVVNTGDGIQNTTMTALDLSDEDEIADIFVWVYFGSVANLTSISARWGNDLTTNYWSGVAQTAQADGTAFQIGWNLIKFSWSVATETGTVTPTTIDSFRVTLVTTGAIANVRVDNIIFSIGQVFDFSYYSKYLFKNSAGTWLSRYASDSDTIVLDSEAVNIFLFEAALAIAHQVEGEDSGFDITFLRGELYDPRTGLYARYRANHPSEEKKARRSWSSMRLPR